jgi:hypothetical protein
VVLIEKAVNEYLKDKVGIVRISLERLCNAIDHEEAKKRPLEDWFAVFFQKRSILSSQGQIIFVYDPWLTPHARKVWKSSKLRPLPNLSVVVLAYEAKRQHRSGNY